MPKMPARERTTWRWMRRFPWRSCDQRMVWKANAVTRQAELGGRSDVEHAVEDQLAAMQFDQRLGDRQTETGTLVAARQVIFNLFKRLQYFFQLLGRDPDPGILDRDQQIPLRIAAVIDNDTAARVGEFHGIGQQVEQDLLEFRLVYPDQRVGAPAAAVDDDQLLVGKRPDGGHRRE